MAINTRALFPVAPPRTGMAPNPSGMGGEYGGIAVQPGFSRVFTAESTYRPARFGGMPEAPARPPSAMDQYMQQPGFTPPNYTPGPVGSFPGIPGFYQGEYSNNRQARMANRAATPAEIALEQQILQAYNDMLAAIAGEQPAPRESGAHFFLGGV